MKLCTLTEVFTPTLGYVTMKNYKSHGLKRTTTHWAKHIGQGKVLLGTWKGTHWDSIGNNNKNSLKKFRIFFCHVWQYACQFDHCFALDFSNFILWILPNLAKYSYGWLALEQHHKFISEKLNTKENCLGVED